MAAAVAMPANDNVRAIAERNYGQAITPAVMRNALLTTRFPLLDRVSLREMILGSMAGNADLALTVGFIRKTGEKHHRVLARL